MQNDMNCQNSRKFATQSPLRSKVGGGLETPLSSGGPYSHLGGRCSADRFAAANVAVDIDRRA